MMTSVFFALYLFDMAYDSDSPRLAPAICLLVVTLVGSLVGLVVNGGVSSGLVFSRRGKTRQIEITPQAQHAVAAAAVVMNPVVITGGRVG